MTTTAADAVVAQRRRWLRHGTGLLLAATARIDDADLWAPTALPAWTRRHVLAHLAANADAVARLVHWAQTGVETPMYASVQQRTADIESGAQLPATALREWVRESAARLDAGFEVLTESAWTAEVTTAQGRALPATELPWLRCREVYVHAVDLAAGVSFEDVPGDVLIALTDDVVAKRGRSGPAMKVMVADRSWRLGDADEEPVDVTGSLPQVVAWLTGRPHSLSAPNLSPWL